LLTAVAPATGAASPPSANCVTVAAVFGNTATTTPLFAVWLTLVAVTPLNVYAFVPTPYTVFPLAATNVTVAVYTVSALNLPPLSAGLQFTFPLA
jgi:hypothetical protein